MLRQLLTTAFALATVVCLGGANWLQFRGNATDGVAEGESLPTKLTSDSIAWKVDLPGRGVSSPLVVGNRVYLTAGSGPDQERLHVICISAADGSTVWERKFWATGRTQTHGSIGVAAPSPASDGKRIFAFYSSNDMACLDLDGNLLWYRGIGHDFPNASNSLGMSSSPIVIGDTVVTQVESDAQAFAVGLDVETGEPKWRMDRPKKANWTSPGVLKLGKRTLALLQSSAGVTAVDPATGKVVWDFDEGASTIPSSTSANGIALVPSNGLAALKTTDAEKPEILWQDGKLGPGTGSPVVSDGRVYVVNRGGVLTAADAATGKIAYRVRLDGKGRQSATPILAGGHAYLVDMEGMIQVVKLGKTSGEVVSKLSLDAQIQGSPAAADGALYVRSDEALWKIAD